MIIHVLALTVLVTSLVGLFAPVATAEPGEAHAATPVMPMTPSPPAKIVADPPLAEPLSRGVVFIDYRTENLRVVPVFGPKAVEVSPPVGHLHVTVDGASWGWADTSGGPLVVFGLPAGPHTIEITLVNANHQPLARSVVEFVIPQRDAAAY